MLFVGACPGSSTTDKVALYAGVVHLTSLTNLKTLNVAYSLAGDASLAALAELTQLEHLDVDSCPMTNTYGSRFCLTSHVRALPAL